MKQLSLVTLFVAAFVLALHSDPVLAINMKTKHGPAISVSGSVNNIKVHVFFKGHNNNHVWEGIWNSQTQNWQGPYKVHDRERRNWAFTKHGLAIAGLSEPHHLIYRGHNDNKIWRMQNRPDGWESIGGVKSSVDGGADVDSVSTYAPGATTCE